MKKSGDWVIGSSGDRSSFEKALAILGDFAGEATHRIQGVSQVLLMTLREIFDENAYERFLRRTHDVQSVESYRAFLRERESGVATRPRCC